MSKMIQVRNVPDDVHRALKARAAAAGMSLSDYVKQDLEAAAARAFSVRCTSSGTFRTWIIFDMRSTVTHVLHM